MMIRWTPTTQSHASQRWQSRAEILKAHLDSLGPTELLRLRPDYYALRFGYEVLKRDYARKFDANQPRVPAGSPGGGQWTNGSEVSGGQSTMIDDSSTDVSSARRRRLEAECDVQYKLDTFKCNLVKSPLCWAQAAERYSACLSGRPIPELRF
jgi:hypothetical protein